MVPRIVFSKGDAESTPALSSTGQGRKEDGESFGRFVVRRKLSDSVIQRVANQER
jgi:hypothetical protein